MKAPHFKNPSPSKGYAPKAAAKIHPAAQHAKIRLPQGPQLDNDPSPVLPNVGRI